MTTTTTNVRIWSLRVYKGVRGETFTVRWVVDGREFYETYKAKPLAVNLLSELKKAFRKGVG